MLAPLCAACVLEDAYFIEAPEAGTAVPTTSIVPNDANQERPASSSSSEPKPPASSDASASEPGSGGGANATVDVAGERPSDAVSEDVGDSALDAGGSGASSVDAGVQHESEMRRDGAAGFCGNGIREAEEACDGADLGARACTDEGFNGGSLRCGAGCALDYSACIMGASCDAVAATRTGIAHRGNTEGMLSSLAEHSCAAGGRGADISIAWTAPFSSCFRFSVTSDRDLDTIAAVYSDCGLLQELACDDNSGADQLSVVEFDARGGTTYALVVDSYFASDEGPVNLHLAPCAPAEWTCPPEFYGRGDGCDCGCGAIDYDCEGVGGVEACAFCEASGGCTDGTSCDTIDPNENWKCKTR